MSGFLDAITAIPAPFNMVVLIILIVMIAAVIMAIAVEARKYFCHRNEIELKREMLDRGMDAQDIERVIRATLPEADKSAD